MSQAGELNTAAGPVPPTVATQYVTDINSPAIPAANTLNVPGNQVTFSNDHGVQTDGSSGSNTLTVQLTNRIFGTATTTDGVTQTQVFSFALGASAGTYLFTINIIAYNRTSSLSAGYVDFAVIRTTGAAGSLILNQPAVLIEEGAMSGTAVTPTISGNNFVLDVVGLAASTIDWKALVTYIVVT